MVLRTLRWTDSAVGPFPFWVSGRIAVRGWLTAMLLSAILIVAISAGQGLRADEPSSPNVSPSQVRFFENHVRPVLARHCYGCHGPKKQEAELRLDSRPAMLRGGESGPAIVPGKPDDSLLIEAVRHESLEMPPTGKLPSKTIDELSRWVAMGAPWPASSALRHRPDAHGFTQEDRDYWAFQPIAPPTPPVLAGDTWSSNPIDRFVLRRLRQAGLDPAPPASPAALVRRLYFDVIGLPPTPAELAYWTDRLQQDAADRAEVELVDALLSSPHFGERWARRWLDVVRYADSDGYAADGYRPLIWRYRDYVVRSFNDDKPFDRFVREQIAGDELYPGDGDAITATGFWRLGVYEHNQRDARSHWTLILNEMTDVVGEAFLGLSIGCARCHDHKFDPIRREDYYRLQALISTTLWTDEPIADGRRRAAYERAVAAWKQSTAAIRRKLDAIEAPVRHRAADEAVSKFPADIQAIYRKPDAERSSLERQLAYLVHRQVAAAEAKITESMIPKEQRGEWKSLRRELARFDRQKPPPLPRVMAVCDAGVPVAPVSLPDDPDATPIAPGFLAVLETRTAIDSTRLSTAESSGRRAALAEWLVDRRQPLTARVIVNRIWHGYFGRGLVETPNEFGRMGQPPSHPELLDFLANYLIENGWRLKPLHRLITTSATYRQSARHPDRTRCAAIDPQNRLRWRADVRRLDGEQIRDAMLIAAGELHRKLGGESVDGKHPRRGLYVRRMRNAPDALLGAFDTPRGFHSVAVRDRTATPGQTLLMLNGPYVLERAEAVARRVESLSPHDPQRVDWTCRLILQQRPAPRQRERLVRFLQRQYVRARPSADSDTAARHAALVDLCHVLFNGNAFLYVE